ncbi:hypothetical protein LG277_09640 [Vreelandella aquamarina]|uniref:hypothetical protein n=1 Tax=Vreelandella aquamarina TaxID=77097 RepID=UPI00384C08D7
MNQGDLSGFAKAVCQRLTSREDSFVHVVTPLAFAYADCATQDYRVFIEHFLATDTP